MKNKITKIQIATIIAFIAYAIWERAVYIWAEKLPKSDPIIRVDLVMIYPVLFILLIISFVQLWKQLGKKK